MHNSLLFNASKDASWINARRLQQHLKKLQEIRSRSTQALPTPSLRHSLKGLSYLKAERLHTIQRDNQLLMKKLVSIAESRGDRHQAGSGAFRSMNLAVRRKEDDRVRAENENLGKRLVQVESGIKKASVRHHYSKSYAFRDQSPSKVLFKVTAMVASDSESRLNASVVEETKARQREKQDLNRSLASLQKAHSGVTLAQYLDAKGEIAVIADVKRVKKKGNLEFAGESKAKPGGNMSKSMRKLEIVRLPGYECKSIAPIAASKPPLYALPQVDEAIPPLQFPAPHLSQHSTPQLSSQLPSSKVRLQRQETVFKASPPSYSQSPAGLQSAPLSKQPSRASQELGELEEQYSEDPHQDSGQTSLESDESEKRRSGLELVEKAQSGKEANSEPQEKHIVMPQLPVFSAHEEEKVVSKRSQSSFKEVADSAPYEVEGNAVAKTDENPKGQESQRQILEDSARESFMVENKEAMQAFSHEKSVPLSPKEEIKADSVPNSPKPELPLAAQEDTANPVQKPTKDSPRDSPEMDLIYPDHSERVEKQQSEEPTKSPHLQQLPTALVPRKSEQSQSARIPLQKPAAEEEIVKRRNTVSHWIIPEALIGFVQAGNSENEALPLSLPAPTGLSAEELEPVPISDSPITDLPPALPDQALPNASITPTLLPLQT